ncbi:MAG TPA: hypothetical protein DCE44_02080 [Verrucomicrobiales bacterium]|nr:hypothetical protein [Verrucomicrobiales bacterium]
MTITVSLPAALEQAMPSSRAKLHLAIGAFVAEEVTLGPAAEIAGVSQAELMRGLSRRRIPLHYDRPRQRSRRGIRGIASGCPQRRHMCSIILSPNSEHLICVAPSIWRAKS